MSTISSVRIIAFTECLFCPSVIMSCSNKQPTVAPWGRPSWWTASCPAGARTPPRPPPSPPSSSSPQSAPCAAGRICQASSQPSSQPSLTAHPQVCKSSQDGGHESAGPGPLHTRHVLYVAQDAGPLPHKTAGFIPAMHPDNNHFQFNGRRRNNLVASKGSLATPTEPLSLWLRPATQQRPLCHRLQQPVLALPYDKQP